MEAGPGHFSCTVHRFLVVGRVDSVLEEHPDVVYALDHQLVAVDLHGPALGKGPLQLT